MEQQFPLLVWLHWYRWSPHQWLRSLAYLWTSSCLSFLSSQQHCTLWKTAFAVNLIITDLVLEIDAIGYTTFQNISFEDKNYETNSVNMYISSTQFFAFCMLTFERFLKVVYPFTHNRLCTKRKIILVIIVSTGVTSGLSFHWDGEHYCIVYYLSTADSMIVSFLVLFCVIMAIFGLNLKILMVARRQRRKS